MANTSRYWPLKAVLDTNRIEREQYESLPPDACPSCGTPLVQARGVRNCPMGDYTYTGGKRLT